MQFLASTIPFSRRREISAGLESERGDASREGQLLLGEVGGESES